MKRDDRAATVVRFEPGISRQGVADRLGLGPTTVSPLVARLLDAGVLREEVCVDRPVERGRRPAGLFVTGSVDALGVITLGHGALDLALVSFDGSILWRRTTAARGRPDTVVIVDAADDLLAAAAGLTGVRRPICLVLALPAPYERGVGLPRGSETPRDPVTAAADACGPEAFADWFGDDPRRLLADRFEIPAVVVNDANLGVLGEARQGAGLGGSVVVYIRLSGIGMGAGLAIHGDLVEGSRGFAGELSHVQVDPDSSRVCICGSRGCLRELVGEGMLDPIRGLYEGDLDYPRFLAMVDADEPAAVRLLQDAGRTLGRTLATVFTFLNPDVLVLDAGSDAASDLVLAGIDEQLQRSVPPFVRSALTLTRAALGPDSVVAGAVHVARAAATAAGLAKG